MVWPIVEPMLKSALDRQGMDRYTTQDIREYIRKKEVTLWIYFDETGLIRAAWTLRAIQYPRKKSMLVEFFGGDDLVGFEQIASDTIQSYAKDNGCDMVECQGRLGWSRPGTRQGWQVIGGLYAKNI